MSDAGAILRDLFGRNAAKKIAREFNISVRTAKAWLAGLFPESRTNELVAVTRKELELIDARHRKIRKDLGIEDEERRGGAASRSAMGRGVDSGSAGPVGEAVDALGVEIADT